MDTVPWKFIDAVVELVGKDTLDELAREVRHPLWKNVVDLHHNNRMHYTVEFRMEEGGIKHVFKNGREVDLSINTQTLRGKERFARIVVINDSTPDFFERPYFNEVEALGEAETTNLLETISPLIDLASGNFFSNWGSTTSTEMLLTSLFKRAYLRGIKIPYCGQIAYDFLEDQIDNSPFLAYIDLFNVEMLRRNWPQSTLDLLTKFCLKGRPGKRVSISLCRGIHLDSSYIQYLLHLWKTNGNLQFELYSFEDIMDEEGIRALMSKGKRPRDARDKKSFFKHDTENSVAVLSSDGYLTMKCYTCECDKFEKCLLKKEYPELHNF
uniref:FBA_2 domain-containing protein n=1 Tax=Steinernema glaseri TaxID=37863 RepID=A0A1I7YGN0_9BILA